MRSCPSRTDRPSPGCWPNWTRPGTPACARPVWSCTREPTPHPGPGRHRDRDGGGRYMQLLCSAGGFPPLTVWTGLSLAAIAAAEAAWELAVRAKVGAGEIGEGGDDCIPSRWPAVSDRAASAWVGALVLGWWIGGAGLSARRAAGVAGGGRRHRPKCRGGRGRLALVAAALWLQHSCKSPPQDPTGSRRALANPARPRRVVAKLPHRRRGTAIAAGEKCRLAQRVRPALGGTVRPYWNMPPAIRRAVVVVGQARARAMKRGHSHRRQHGAGHQPDRIAAPGPVVGLWAAVVAAFVSVTTAGR